MAKKATGLSKPVEISEALADLIDHDGPLPRSQITKLVWEYIKENDLQDEDDKRTIICDAKMKKVFKVAKFNMFKMAGLLSPHIE